ncbi:MAG: response regulator [Betaproteobacteria bacterium]
MPDARGLVVLVEDDTGMRDAAERVLAATGFEVLGFDSAESALQDRATLDARCLVLDVHLPGISGFELYERLLAVGRKPAVVFISARDDTHTKVRSTQFGALAFLVKPFSGHTLCAVVAKAFV